MKPNQMKTEYKYSGPQKGNYHIQVLDRAVEVLNAVAQEGPELSVTELAAQLRLRRSTAHRLVMVLECNNFLQRDAVTGKCRLGPRLMQLGLVALSRLDLSHLSQPHLKRLVDEVEETAHLGLLTDSEVISIVNVQCRHPLRFPSTVGAKSPVHCTSQGKAILAFSPPEVVHAVLEHGPLKLFTRNTVTSKARFLEELREIREQGYAIDDEEYEIGLRCIAAPVRDVSGEVIAALSIAGPAFRMGDDRIEALSAAVMHAAARVSSSIGFSGRKKVHD